MKVLRWLTRRVFLSNIWRKHLSSSSALCATDFWTGERSCTTVLSTRGLPAGGTFSAPLFLRGDWARKRADGDCARRAGGDCARPACGDGAPGGARAGDGARAAGRKDFCAGAVAEPSGERDSGEEASVGVLLPRPRPVRNPRSCSSIARTAQDGNSLSSRKARVWSVGGRARWSYDRGDLSQLALGLPTRASR